MTKEEKKFEDAIDKIFAYKPPKQEEKLRPERHGSRKQVPEPTRPEPDKKE